MPMDMYAGEILAVFQCCKYGYAVIKDIGNFEVSYQRIE